jgi:DNA-binding CsgD family transcriptional regulator
MLLHETEPLKACRSTEAGSRLIRLAVHAMSGRVEVAQRRQEAAAPVCVRDDDLIVHATMYQPTDEPMILVHVAMSNQRAEVLPDEELTVRYHLTPAELRVARLLAAGKSNKHIAAELGLSEHTTRHHTERVLRKLSINSRSAVARKLSSG